MDSEASFVSYLGGYMAIAAGVGEDAADLACTG